MLSILNYSIDKGCQMLAVENLKIIKCIYYLKVDGLKRDSYL